MSDPGDLARREDAVRRLRELHNDAGEEDGPAAALLLGLALADLAARLPDNAGARRSDLAVEGLARLSESGGASAAAADAAEILRGYAAAAAGGPVREPEVFPLGGGNLNWNLNWPELRAAAQAAQNLAAMLPFLASMLPPHDPQREALQSITQVLGAFERGQWSPERDAALRAAITQAETSGLGAGLGVILRTVAMFVRAQRCQQVQQEGGQPDWPSPAELDTLIADLDSADELAGSLGAPFQAIEGLHHLFIAFVIVLRLQAGVQARGIRQDAAWRNGILQLLDRADDHLRQAPGAYGGVTQPMRSKLAGISAALRGSPSPPPAPPASAPGPAAAPPPAPPAPSPADPMSRAAPTPARTQPAGSATAGQGAQPWPVDPAAGLMSQQVLGGLRVLLDRADGPVGKGLATLLQALDMVNSRRWSPEYSDQLAELEDEAARLSSRGESPRDHATVAAMLAMAHAASLGQRSISPRPAEHPSAGEMAAAVAETESALDLLAQAHAGAPDQMLAALRWPLHALAAMQRVDLSRLDGEHRAEQLARSRAHFAQLPPEILGQLPVISEMSVLEKLIEGVIPPDDESVTPVINLNPNMWDQSGSDLNRAMRTVARARHSRMPGDIGAALGELQAIWIGLPAYSALRTQVLIPMAAMQSLLAEHGGPHHAADAVGTAAAAVRAAAQTGEVHAAAELLVTTFALMLSRGEHAGPSGEAEETLRTALAKFAATGNWALQVTVLTAIAAATVMQAEATGEEMLRTSARQAAAEAARMLGGPVPARDWYAATRLLCTWTTAQGLYLGDSEAAEQALRLLDMLETVLTGHPEVASHQTPPATGPAGSSSAEFGVLRQLRHELLEACGQHAAQPPEEPS